MCGRFSQAYTWAQIHAFSRPIGLPVVPLTHEIHAPVTAESYQNSAGCQPA